MLADIPHDAETIELGLMPFGRGVAWFDDVEFSVLGPAGFGDDPPRPLTDRALDNLVALTRLQGYVQHFHPADEAARIDWDAFTIRALRAAEHAADREQLGRLLHDLFRSIAPTVELSIDGNTLGSVARVEPTAESGRLVWRHFGASDRVEAGELDPPPTAAANAPMPLSLGHGLTARVPSLLFTDIDDTLPHGIAELPGIDSASHVETLAAPAEGMDPRR